MVENNNNLTFDVDVNGETIKLKIKNPSADDIRESRKIYNKTFKEVLDSGAMLKAKLDSYLEEQGIWGSDVQNKYSTLKQQVDNKVEVLQKGGITKLQARKIALEIIELRDKMTELLSVRAELAGNTAEGQANDAKFTYLVYACLVYDNTDKRYFKSYDDFLENGGIIANKASELLASRMFPIFGLNIIDMLPERQFLKKYNFIDENGNLINESGELVDKNMNKIDVDIKPIPNITDVEFLDD